MARVSQEHLDARRRQILDGAARCFARNGFHGTSMQDVFKEVGLSAGAVYRYFPGKEDIIAAITKETFAVIRGAFEEASRMTPPPTPDALLGRVLGGVLAGEVHGLERRPSPRSSSSSGPRRCATNGSPRCSTTVTPPCASPGRGSSTPTAPPGS